MILQQAQLQHLLFRNHPQPGMAEPSPEPSPSLNRALTTTEPSSQPTPIREPSVPREREQTGETPSTCPPQVESNTIASNNPPAGDRTEVTTETPQSSKEQTNEEGT